MSNTIAEGSVLIMGRKRGRPRVEEPMERIDVRLPVSSYDALIKIALARGESVSSITRSLLITRVGQLSSVKK